MPHKFITIDSTSTQESIVSDLHQLKESLTSNINQNIALTIVIKAGFKATQGYVSQVIQWAQDHHLNSVHLEPRLGNNHLNFLNTVCSECVQNKGLAMGRTQIVIKDTSFKKSKDFLALQNNIANHQRAYYKNQVY